MKSSTSAPPRFFVGGKRKPAQDRYFKEVLLRAGWEEGNDHNWDSCWFTGMPSPAFFDRLKPGMSINHIPGNNRLTIKSLLASTVSDAKNRLLEQGDGTAASHLDFVPQTFCMPEDHAAFLETAAAHPERRWILKPKNASKGKGISLVTDPAQVPKHEKWLVQEYIRNPHLYNGHKYVLRLYVLIASLDPLRMYLFHEGSMKLTSVPYDAENFDNIYSHLTNPDINVKNDQSEHPVVFLSFADYRSWLREQDIDDQALFQRIERMITLTVIAAHGKMRERLERIKGYPSGCHELLGIDCLIDANLKPWIMECNLSPSLDICAESGYGLEAESQTKRALVGDSLQLLGIPDRLPRSPAPEEKNPFQTILNLAREEAERSGGYKRLFPDENAIQWLRYFPFPRFNEVLLSEAVTGETHLPRKLRPHHVREHIEGTELTLIDQRDQKSYRLNATAAWIWLQAADGAGPEEISQAWLDQLRREAGETPPPEAVRKQVWDLLADWVKRGFLRSSVEG